MQTRARAGIKPGDQSCITFVPSFNQFVEIYFPEIEINIFAKFGRCQR